MTGLLSEVRATIWALLALAVAGFIIWKKWGADAVAAIPSAAEVAASVRDIAKGAGSAAISVLRGEQDTTYITTDEQRARAAALLAEHRRQNALLSGGN